MANANVKIRKIKIGIQGTNILKTILPDFSWFDKYTVKAPSIVGKKNRNVKDITEYRSFQVLRFMPNNILTNKA
ncbi:hypothetical protein Musp01_12320 [Muricauda sp. NBRC 101325]|nr:hypothetical protein Musp01_12320 [Muricauda sp. NBRC 101325]